MDSHVILDAIGMIDDQHIVSAQKRFGCDFLQTASVPQDVLMEVMTVTQENKKMFSIKKYRVLAVCAVIMALLACTAFAIHYANTVLTYFNGDTTLIEPNVQVVDKVQKQGEYMLNVDSILSDAHNTVIALTIEALTDDAVTSLNSERFCPTDILRFDPENSVGIASVTYTAVPAEADSVKRSFIIHLSGIGAPNTLRLHLNGHSDEEAIVLTLDKQIESLSATAVPTSEISDYFIRSCELNATGLTLEVKFKDAVKADKIVEFYFRMADGSLKTLSQLCGKATGTNIQNTALFTGVQENTFLYTATFRTLIDPLQIAGVIMNGMEYSFLDPNYVVPVEIPVTMRPFLTPYVEVDDVFYFFAYDVCEHIGASIKKDGEQYTIQYLDKALSFTPENRTASLNGEPHKLDFPATYENSDLLLSREFFTLLGLENSMYYPELGPVHAPENWLVTP